MQNPCQLAHWHACCTPCKTRANLGCASCWHECCNTSNTRATSNVGTDVAPHAKPMPTLDLARMLQHKQNTCQLWTCKSRANSYPQVIHRLSTGCPMQNPCHFQCWHRCCYARSVPIVGQMLDKCWAGEGLDLC
jgi:hypothetical protein